VEKGIEFLYSLIDYERWKKENYEFKLDNYINFLKKINNPEKKLKNVVIVAGTKGKGSTATMIAGILKEHGNRTGLYLSPHLKRVEERVSVDFEPIKEEELSEIIMDLKPFIESQNPSITFFEALTTACFLYFLKKNTEFSVLEVGLGARLDATNVTQPIISAITKIDLDHTNILGDKVEKIAREKSFVMRKNKEVVIGRQKREAEEELLKMAYLFGSKPFVYGKDFHTEIIQETPYKTRFSLIYHGRREEFILNMPGAHQVDNAAVAVVVANNVLKDNYDYKKTKDALEKVKIRGRIEILKEDPWIIVDIAHNDCSTAVLRDYLNKFHRDKRKILIIGVTRGKDIKKIFENLLPLFETVIVTKSSNPRAVDEHELYKTARIYKKNVEAKENVKEALFKALETLSRDHLLCITGSTYVVGDALLVLENENI